MLPIFLAILKFFTDERHYFYRSGAHPGVPPRKAIVGSPSAPDDLPSSDEESSSDDEKSRVVSPAKKECSSLDLQTVSFQVSISINIRANE